ncbi:hypothetical protein JCM8547_005266, partial [Rhodosporidiobolus lusitaniae]
MTARDFGTCVETLADACFDRKVDEADRIATFVYGLNSQYSEFVRTQEQTLALSGRKLKTLDEYVRVAAVADGLDSFSSSLKSSSRKSAANPSSMDEKTQKWRARAAEWQLNHPLSNSAEWKSDGSMKPAQQQYCYNCGRYADHYSRSC